jgi:hypothetical protein
MKRTIGVLMGLALLLAGPAAAQEKKDPVVAVDKKEVAKRESPLASPPASQPAGSASVAPVTPPADAKQAIEAGKTAIEAAKQGRWWYFSSLICLILMFVLKLVGVLEKMGRWKYIVLPVLSLAAALLATFQGGVTIENAIGVFASSWAMGMLEELVNHGVLGKPHTPS